MIRRRWLRLYLGQTLDRVVEIPRVPPFFVLSTFCFLLRAPNSTANGVLVKTSITEAKRPALYLSVGLSHRLSLPSGNNYRVSRLWCTSTIIQLVQLGSSAPNICYSHRTWYDTNLSPYSLDSWCLYYTLRRLLIMLFGTTPKAELT